MSIQMVIKLKKIILLLLFLNFIFIGKVWAIDYTQDVACLSALTMDIDEDPIDDVSPNSNTAALKGAGEPDFATASPPAAYSTGYYVWDGTNDYAQITDFIASNQDYVSVVGWTYFNTQDTDDYVSKYGLSPTDGYIFFRDDTDAVTSRTDCFTILLSTTGTDYRLSSATNSALSGAWIHISFTFSSSTYSDELSFYKNGVEDANSPQMTGDGLMVNPSSNCFIGAASTSVSSNILNGNLDEFAYFNDVLTPTEINDIMDNGLVGAAPSARRIWIMD